MFWYGRCEQTSSSEGGLTLNILVVDDITITRALLRQMLAGKHTVMEAATVKDAVAILRSTEIHLVITDFTMPDGDGIAVLEAAANGIIKTSPVILFTASTEDRILSFARGAGFAKVLNKPLSAERIEEMLAVCANSELVAKEKEGSSV